MGKTIAKISDETIGLIYGFIGLICFSGTLPATRIAVISFDATIVGLGRALVAAIFKHFILCLFSERTNYTFNDMYGDNCSK